MGKFQRSPALHFLLIGGLCFSAWLVAGGGVSPGARERIVIPTHRVNDVERQFFIENRRRANAAEYQEFVEEIIDQEVLYRYALKIGMIDEPVVQRRLAQIAVFVDSNPHDPLTEKQLAAKTLDLGLHHSDLIVRRILIDGARRLIRAVVLVREPKQSSLEDFIVANRELFMRPAETRITHVLVNRLACEEDTEARARTHLARIRSENLSPEQAVLLEEPAYIDPVLPLLTDQDIGRRFGFGFVEMLAALPVGEWSGPINSRYGAHVVYVYERQPAYLPTLEEIRPEVQKRLLEKIADEWLALRLQQIRADFDIILPERSQ